LDLKDSFHQIKIHPEFTKYFAFATPDGQFEYMRLPFGFCEAPAEFQKRLVQILQPLLREDNVIVYIDDILIPTTSVQENLDIIKKVLLLFKQHRFEVNYAKCHFLKTTVEYLGYILSPSGITISQRHTDVIQNFPIPKKVIHIQRFLGLTISVNSSKIMRTKPNLCKIYYENPVNLTLILIVLMLLIS